MLYFIACCSFSVIFSLRATMLINLNLSDCQTTSDHNPMRLTATDLKSQVNCSCHQAGEVSIIFGEKVE